MSTDPALDEQLALMRRGERDTALQLVIGGLPLLLGLAGFRAMRRARRDLEAAAGIPTLADVIDADSSEPPGVDLTPGLTATGAACDRLAELLGAGWTVAVAGDFSTALVRYEGIPIDTLPVVAAKSDDELAAYARVANTPPGG